MYTALMYKSELHRPARYPWAPALAQPAGEGGGGRGVLVCSGGDVLLRCITPPKLL